MAGAGSKKWARLRDPNLAASAANAQVSRRNKIQVALNPLPVASPEESTAVNIYRERRSSLHGPNRSGFHTVNHLF